MAAPARLQAKVIKMHVSRGAAINFGQIKLTQGPDCIVLEGEDEIRPFLQMLIAATFLPEDAATGGTVETKLGELTIDAWTG